MRALTITLTLTLALSVNLAKAVSPDFSPAKDSTKKIFILSIVPQYTIHNGFRMDFDIRLSKQHWLMLSPIYYMGTRRQFLSGNNDRTYNVEGYGIDIYDKIFLKKTTKPFGPYFAIGLKYHEFFVKYKDYTWVEFEDNGLKYYDYEYNDVKETIIRYGANLIFGYQQSLFKEKMQIDFFGGYGLKISEVRMFDESKAEVFTDRFWDYGYSGPHLLLGIRLGVLF